MQNRHHNKIWCLGQQQQQQQQTQIKSKRHYLFEAPVLLLLPLTKMAAKKSLELMMHIFDHFSALLVKDYLADHAQLVVKLVLCMPILPSVACVRPFLLPLPFYLWACFLLGMCFFDIEIPFYYNLRTDLHEDYFVFIVHTCTVQCIILKPFFCLTKFVQQLYGTWYKYQWYRR